jgi:hypothetical protein
LPKNRIGKEVDIVRRVFLACLLIGIAVASFCLLSCDSYKIVESRFYSEKDITDVPTCDEYEGGWHDRICWGDKSQKQLSILFSFEEDPSHVRLYILGSAGNVVKILVDELCGAGSHMVNWDGRDKEGRKIEDGVYGVSLQAGSTKWVIWFEID